MIIVSRKYQYDIFISYRHDGGSETAKLIRDSLKKRGYRVFLDIESLRAGQFNRELYRVIEKSKDVIVILPKDGLDRCCNENDWLRLEIEHAAQCGKNIIPVFLNGFEMPESFPPSLEFLRTQQGLFASMEFYDAFIKRLRRMLKAKPFPVMRTSLALLGAAIILTCICFAVHQSRNSPSHEAKATPAATSAADAAEANSGYSANLFIDSLPGTYKNKSSINPYGVCICQYQILHDTAANVNVKVVVDILDNMGLVHQNEIEFPNHETSKWDTVDVDMFEPERFDGGTITFRFYVKETDALIGSISAALSRDSSYYARTVKDNTALTYSEHDGVFITTEKVKADTVLLIEKVADGKAYFQQDGKTGYVSLEDIEPLSNH